MTLAFNLDLDRVKVNQHAEYLQSMVICSKANVQTQRQTSDKQAAGQLLFLDHHRGQ